MVSQALLPALRGASWGARPARTRHPGPFSMRVLTSLIGFCLFPVKRASSVPWPAPSDGALVSGASGTSRHLKSTSAEANLRHRLHVLQQYILETMARMTKCDDFCHECVALSLSFSLSLSRYFQCLQPCNAMYSTLQAQSLTLFPVVVAVLLHRCEEAFLVEAITSSGHHMTLMPPSSCMPRSIGGGRLRSRRWYATLRRRQSYGTQVIPIVFV